MSGGRSTGGLQKKRISLTRPCGGRNELEDALLSTISAILSMLSTPRGSARGKCTFSSDEEGYGRSRRERVKKVESTHRGWSSARVRGSPSSFPLAHTAGRAVMMGEVRLESQRELSLRFWKNKYEWINAQGGPSWSTGCASSELRSLGAAKQKRQVSTECWGRGESQSGRGGGGTERTVDA